MTKEERIGSELTEDERRLIRLFRCLDVSEQHELLRQNAVALIAKTPIDRTFGSEEEHRAQEAEELTWDLEERLLSVKPPMEPWDYLDDYIYPTLEAAWAEGVADVILGSSAFDTQNSEELVRAVEETADTAAFPEPPWFEIEDMLKFIRAWREAVFSALEQRTPGAPN